VSSLQLIFGRLQKGKSTLAEHLAELQHKAVFVFDPGETYEIGTIVLSGDEMRDVIARDNPREGIRVPLPIVFRSDDPERDISDFVLIVLGYGDCSVIVDEASFLQSPHSLHPALSRLIRKGPKQIKNRDFFLTQHRPQDCNGLVAGMAHEYIFFETTLDRDLERIEEWCGPEVAERVAKLGFRDWLGYNVGSKRFYVNNAPDSWRVDLSPRSPRGDQELEIPSRPLVSAAR